MEFLTKSMIREKLEEFLINYDSKHRFQFQESNDREFIQIGQPVERIVSKYQTFLNLAYKKISEKDFSRHIQDDEETQYDKDIRQDNLSLSGK